MVLSEVNCSYCDSSCMTTESNILIALVVSSSSSGENCISYPLSSAGSVELPLSNNVDVFIAFISLSVVFDM